jgi:hypothetical protein
MPRFVILEHDFPQRHWDFLLEVGDHLRSWRLSARPEAGGATRAEAIADHRLLYLDYEGAIGGGRGRVERWDSGYYTQIEFGESRVIVILEGRRCRGQAALDRTDAREWRFSLTNRDNQAPA